MSAVEILGLAASVSLLSGWRLYLCVFVTGLAMKLGWVALPEQLKALEVLANPYVIGIAAFGTVAEFFADKVPWLDSLWDGIHTLVRPVGGAALALALVDPGDPTWQVATALLGGGASFLTHAAKSGTRALVNTSPEPLSNVVVSTTEDVVTGLLLWSAYSFPAIAAGLAAILLAGAVAALFLIRRAIGRIMTWRRARRTA